MTKKKEEEFKELINDQWGEETIELYGLEEWSNTIRVHKKDRKRIKTTIEINKSIQGDSIETMMERIKEGGEEDAIPDRDVVYNDQEADSVNPVTNIRSDKFELMLEEKDGEYQHRNRKHMKVVKDEEEKKESETPKEGSDTGTTE